MKGVIGKKHANFQFSSSRKVDRIPNCSLEASLEGATWCSPEIERDMKPVLAHFDLDPLVRLNSRTNGSILNSMVTRSNM